MPNTVQQNQPLDKITRRRRMLRSFEAKALANRKFGDRVADALTTSFGGMNFLIINCYWFAIWIVLNTNIIPGIKPFDPFPFGLLTMIVSLEAIVLSIVVLVSQNRAAHIDTLRSELQLQVNLIAEEEITKSLELLADIRKKVGIHKEDPELERMLERINTSYIERSLQKQIDTNTGHILNIGANKNGNGLKNENMEEKESAQK
jgi:uncharacterized membrane protein